LRERYSDVCDSLLRWTDKHIKSEDEVYINIGYGSYVVQVAFYVMAEAGIFPRKTFFLNCYDSKNDDKNLRFKDFVVAQVPVRLFSGMRRQVESIFKNTKSPARKLADELLTFYLNKIETAFTILILGERGVGKTRLVRTIASKTKGQKEIVYVNCASFDDDNKAESELFGYEKGAFTGANTDKKGLFLEARNKILFLDEVHHLSKFVQAKLMTALQTDDNGNFKVRRMGSNETIDVKCTVIFASNRTIEQLRRELLPDFYDRISQLVVEIPPLRETREDRKADWEATWKHLFKNDNPKKDNREAEVRNSFDSEVPNSSDLIEWLEGEDLPGNFRDLEKIALAYKMYMDFPETIKSQLEQKSALDYVRDQYRKYHGFHASSSLPSFELDLRLAPKVLEKNFLRFMAQELVKKYGSPEKVEKECKQLFGDDGVTAKTVRNWLGDS
ncbi:MAG: sigma 54-interacting transcriptional regulator, partial [Bacteroidia bacterium]|nr:sigma-54 factor interaction domain-containing protein [Bacteroidia bacterium]MDW8334463.1 sigma 54-interacting transcriptional regulator [Bacteroidia bacterium]